MRAHLHRSDRASLAGARVSEMSEWNDPVWRFPLTTAGQLPRAGEINWRIQLADGSWLTDPRHERLLEGWKRVVWGAFVESGDGKNRKWESVGSIGWGVLYLCRWMAEHAVPDVTALTPAVVEDFLADLAVDKGEGRDISALSHRLLARYVQPLGYVWWARKALEEVGFGKLTEDPLRGRSVRQVCKSCSAVPPGSIPAMPDQAFIAIVNAATAFIERNAERLILANNVIADLRLDDKLASATRIGEITGAALREAGVTAKIGELRRDVSLLRTACWIIVQAMTGIRVSELCGLEVSRIDAETGLPDCIVAERTEDDHYELLYIKGLLFKTSSASEPTRWVAGLRPTGSGYLSPPVQAITTLASLDRGWRLLAKTTRLCLQFRATVVGFPNVARNIVHLTNAEAVTKQRKWIRALGGLEGELREARYTTHMWRKTFAQYMVRTAPGLLPAISAHFKHVTQAMTEIGYLKAKTGDLELNDLIRAERSRQAAQVIHELATGERTIAGPKAEWMARHVARIVHGLNNRPPGEIRKDIEEIVLENNFTLWDSEFGYCVFAAEGPKCHSLAGPLGSWARRAPNFAERSPPRCVECPHFAVAGEHEPFWRRRLEDNLAKWEQSMKHGGSPPAVAAQFREGARQSEIVLTWLARERADASQAP